MHDEIEVCMGMPQTSTVESAYKRHRRRLQLQDAAFKKACLAGAVLMGLVLFAIVGLMGKTGLLVFKDVSPWEFFFSLDWTPENGHFGAGVFIIGTFVLTGLTLLIAVPLSLSLAIFTAEIAPAWMKGFLRAALNLLVGIPSIIYGHIGITVLIPYIRQYTGAVLGDGLLAASIVLALMVLPTITSIADDSLTALPDDFREAAYGVGSTRWQMITRILVPGAKNGIITGVILGMARAIGETMAVVMVIGNVAQLPANLTTPTTVLTSNIVMQILGVEYSSTWSNALYMMAFLLLVISLGLILVVRKMSRKGVAV